MNFKVFFDHIRPKFKIKDSAAVAGYELIINEGIRRRVPLRWIAYLLATAYHETAATMLPITEFGGRKYFDKYDTGKLAKALGNTQELDGDGYTYRGRGYVQITGKANYEKFGIADNPDAALDPLVAVKILYEGSIHGMFTGKKLSDYINDRFTDYINARRIINGVDRASTIAKYAESFMEALDAAIDAK